MFKAARQRIKTTLAEYGVTAVTVWATTWTVALGAFTFSAQCAAAATGAAPTTIESVGLAYPAFVATYPLRVAATVTLTPPIALTARRLRDRVITGRADV